MPTAEIVRLLRYPIKGFDGEPLEEAEIAPGETFALDCAVAVEN